MPKFSAYNELTATAADDLFIVDDVSAGETKKIKASNMPGGAEITGTSLVSGTITLPGGDVTAGDAHYGSTNLYLYGGPVTAQGGDITGSNPAAGHYFYGGELLFRAGDCTISGNASVASTLAGGTIDFTGGDTTVDAGERPSRFRGGSMSFTAGSAIETGVATASGAAARFDAGGLQGGTSGGDCDLTGGNTTQAGGTGGRVLLKPGAGGAGGTNGVLQLVDSNNGIVIQIGPTDGTLGFYGTGAIAQQTGVAVNIASVHAALVALGLITA